MNIGKLGIVALTAALLAATPAFAKKHVSNTFGKIGNTIQYGVRKDTSNLSIDTHRAINHNSVAHRRNGNRTYRSIVTPGGHIKRLHRVHSH